MPHRGPSPSDYTAPVSEEERQAWNSLFTRKYAASPLPKILQTVLCLGIVLAILYFEVETGFSFWGGVVLGLFLLALLACVIGMLTSTNELSDSPINLRQGVIVNRILNTHTDVLVRQYAQCSYVDEYGHKRFDDDRWQKEETRFTDTVWVPEASKFMREDVAKFHIERQDRLVDLIGAEYEERKTGIIATFREDMNPFDYEHFCAAILNENGWNACATQGSGDQGVDVIAEKDSCRVAIQCKLYSSNVGNKAVQEVIAGSIHANAAYRAVVSNRDFTTSAYEIAEKIGVKLLHHNDLQDLDRALGLASVNGSAAAQPERTQPKGEKEARPKARRGAEGNSASEFERRVNEEYARRRR